MPKKQATKQATKRRLIFKTTRGEETHAGYSVGIELIDEATNEVAWQRKGFVKRVGPMRYDYSDNYSHRRDLLAYLLNHTEDIELCDRQPFPNP